MQVSVVVPVYNGEATLADCLRSLAAQDFPGNRYEIIVVDDGSSDATAAIAADFDVRLIRQQRGHESGARNAGMREARGEWVAFTDADCIVTRRWLRTLMDAVAKQSAAGPVLGAAGSVIGYESRSPAARFVDLSGGLNMEDHLAHPTFPYALMGNSLYRRSALLAVGGLDERYTLCPGADLHYRLRQAGAGRMVFAPGAVVLHRHRESWRAFWRQQRGYGIGYAKLLLHYRQQFAWTVRHEARAWRDIAVYALGACIPGAGDRAVLRRGRLIQNLARRIGFLSTYWNPRERRLWNEQCVGDEV